MLKIGSKKNLTCDNKATIRLLDDNDVIECEFQSYHKGRYLLDFVFNHLNLLEADYFGLRYVDQQKQRHWLDPNRNILRQMKGVSPLQLCFRVKFYPCQPLQLQEEVSRYQLFLQLRRDLLHGRLYCSHADAAHLAALLLQAELGDHSAQQEGYVQQCRLLVRQTPKLEEKIEEIHSSLAGTTTPQAETQFLKKAATLDTYGVDPHPVKDQKGNQVYLGLSHGGLLTFQGSKKTQHFKWSEVQRLNYEGKMFIAHITIMEIKHTVGFKCTSASACKHLWRAAVEQRLFYTLPSCRKRGVVVTGGSFFSRGSRFRYQGRCEREVVMDSTGIMREAPTVRRTPYLMPRSASLPTTPPHHGGHSEEGEDNGSSAHRRLPYIDRSSSMDDEVLCGGSPAQVSARSASRGVSYCPESNLPPLLEPGEALEAPESLEAHEDAQALHAAWSRGSYSRSHTLELPEDGAHDPDSYHPTGSLPRHVPSYTPPSPPQLNTPHNTPLLPHDEKQTPTIHQTPSTPHLSAEGEPSNSGPPLLSHTLPRHNTHSPTASLHHSPQLSYASAHSTASIERGSGGTRSSAAVGQPRYMTPSYGTLNERRSPIHKKMDSSFDKSSLNGNSQPVNSLTSLNGNSQPIISTQLRSSIPKTRNISAFGEFARIFVRVFVCVVLLTVVLCVGVLESTSPGISQNIRSRPEMVLFRLQYYEPLKRAIWEWFKKLPHGS